MTTTAVARALYLVIFIGAATSTSSASAQTADAEEWGSKTADALERFFPQPVPGLIERFPWDARDFDNVVKGWGCGESTCPTYLPVNASRSWRIADPSAAREYESVTRQEEDLVRRAEERGRNITQNEQMEIMGKLQQLGEQKAKLGVGSRYVEMRLRANLTPEDRLGVKAKPVGDIKGRPFYRRPDGSRVHLTVYVGPPGFSNRDPPPGQKPRLEMKCILVEVEVASNPASLKADEALGRQMVEKIDFAGLAQLFRP